MSMAQESPERATGPFPGCASSCRAAEDGVKCSLHTRRACLIRATLEDDRGLEFDVLIHNVSGRRIGVTCKGGHPREGHAVSLTLSDGQVLSGQVTLYRDGYCDIELAAELDVEMFSDIARHRKEFLRDDAEWGITEGHKVIASGPDPARMREI